ncbi:non-ribosomal peptide synthase/polyketide synthase [Pseudomonas brenneri]|uniref:non-ribosomal peptide synthase/polyketide synthase n=2 Tax=Pseudomonas brenneri TaxID=129817 RepID=UPI00357169CA
MQELIESVGKLSAKQRKALAVLLKQKGLNLFTIAPVFQRAAEEPLLLSYAQQRQWFLWQWAPQSTAYNIPTALRLKGRLDVAALQRSIEALVDRHESLRSVFTQQDDQPLQVVLPAGPFALDVDELHLPQGEALEAYLQAFVEQETGKLFDLQAGPLMRARLLRLAADDHVLVVTLHHIVSDGWSMQVMVEELVQFYAGFSQGQTVQLPALTIQYPDYAQWQRQWMEAGEQERQLAYWQDKLGGEQPVLELPTDFPRPALQSFAGASCRLILDEALAESLKTLAKRENTTLFVLLLASFQVLLHRYSGQEDIRVGVPVANRGRAEIERLIGFFVNTQVLKADIDGQGSFIELLRQVRQTAQDAQAHQDLPFEQLVEALQPGRSLSHSPLFQVMFNHQAESRSDAQTGLSELHVERLEWQSQTAQFDLVLNTVEHAHGIEAVLKYATDLFDASTIERLAQHWQHLLQAVVADPAQRIAQLPLLATAHERVILEDWNRTAAAYPAGQCIQQLIEEQAARTPDAVALVFAEQQLSYAELNTRANQWAHRLLELGVGPDVLVGVAVERSLEMVVGLLAVLKAGGAYVPLDPEYPQDRLGYMIEDSGLKLLLSQAHLALPIPAHVQALDLGQALSGYSSANPQVTLDPENLAYAIYTSGSTGKPKGVMVRHGALTNFIVSMAAAPGIGAQDRLLSLTTFSFDIFGLELYTPLMVGGRVVLASQDTQRDPELILQQVQAQGITLLQATPSTWRMLLESPNAGILAGRRLLCGGEALADELAVRMTALGAQTWNLYGPTETTIWSALQPLSSEHSHPYLGKAIHNTSLYILGEDLSANPVGVAGELLIGGDGLARGYFERPALTAERFLPNPYGEPGGRFYRTGDLARYRADGVIDYISRIDHQVKIRGFRIELGEIEARLLEHAEVREAVVVAQDGAQGPVLVSYLVAPEASEDSLREALKHSLHQQLPDYMVPQYWLFMERLPLTPNGKLDRKALPKPDASQVQKTYVAPSTERQQQVAQIWQDVLKLEQVGLADNFFELGGHSLLATQVMSRVRQLLNAEVPLRTLFEHSTLQAFVQALEPDASGQEPLLQAPALIRIGRDQSLPLSYAQERQWFLWQLAPDSAAYHIPTALRLRGTLDVAALERSFNALLARHESLRTQFIEEGGGTVQVVQPEMKLTLAVEPFGPTADFDTRLKARVDQEISQLFNLHQGPLLRAKLLQLAADDYVLIVTQHHIVSDRWSMKVTVDELIELYAGYSQGQDVQLPALPIQYADYALWQRQWMDSGERERQLAYWLEQLGGEQPVLELPTDHPRPAQQSYRGAQVQIPLSAELGAALKQLAQREQVTLFMLLLASFQALLHRYSGQNDIRVGVPIANRNRLETERLIGFFVNTQVLKAEFSEGLSFRDFLGQVRRSALAGQAWQDLPFEQLVDRLQPERSLSHNPLFQVMFNHQSQDPQHLSTRIRLDALHVEGLSWESATAQFDLTLNTFESEDGVSASLIYATDLFEAASIERLALHWQTLLQGIVSDPQQSVAELPLLSIREAQLITHDWNANGSTFADQPGIQQLIEARAKQQPDALALVAGEQTLSYAQLNARANQLAHRLIELGIAAEVRVGVAMPRSSELVIALLAVLKAGGAYVPLDPDYPQDRVAYMLEDSQAKVLLIQASLLEQLPQGNAQVMLVEAGGDAFAGYPQHNPGHRGQSSNLAYVIYTSGSTGKPKGVAIAHRNVLALIHWSQQVYSQDDLQGVLASTSVCFDLSVWEIFVTLASGGSIVMARNALELPDLAARDQVRLINTVPSAIAALQRAGQIPASVRIINLAGEPLKQSLVEVLYAQPTVEHVYDLYGPSEDTTYSTWTRRAIGASANIGRPLDNTASYLLDQQLQTVPIGVAAELYLAGEGITRGYLFRPGLTAERYVPNPFSTTGERLYRTGDLTRYRADGVIEYVGRIDHQVKVRGFRIELGEIEARLLALESVREGVVLAIEGASGQQLVAYLVASVSASEGAAALGEAIKAQLKEHLPEYMVPAHVVFLDQLPLTPNGKLDRKALPVPDLTQNLRAYLAPGNALERQLVAIWQDILKLEQVGVTDNFFTLGGDSIISIQVVSRARQAGIRFTPKDLFQQQTVQRLARVAEVGEPHGLVEQGPVSGACALLPVQQWFFEQAIPERQRWNQSVLLKPLNPLDPQRLEQALQALISHHDGLRLSFDPQNLTASYRSLEQQQLLPAPLWHKTVADLGELEWLADQAQGSLGLEHGPLLRAVLFELPGGEQRLLLVVHHLVVDGVSWRILLEDLQEAYRQLLAGQVITFGLKTVSFKRWVEHLQIHGQSAALLQQLPYWQAQGLADAAQLPCDNPQGSLQNCHAQTVYTRLNSTLTRQLLQDTAVAYRTQINDLLLAALARVICRWTGQDSTLIQLEGHGREELFEQLDLTRTLGWFTSMFPVNLTPADAIADSIKQIKEQLRAVPDRGIGFGLLRYLGDEPTRQALSQQAVPRITFNYLGQFDGSFDAEDGVLFVPATEAKGAEHSPLASLGNWLSLNGQVYGGELSLGWTFSEQMFSEPVIQRLADEYARELEQLIEHCCQPQHRGLTPSDFPLATLTQQQLDELPASAGAIEDVYALSPMQRGMLFHTLYEPQGGSYTNQVRLDVEGLDPQRFLAAWQATMDARDVLRTSFVWQGSLEQPVQVVHPHVSVPFTVLDWQGRADLMAQLDARALAERAQGFDLTQAPLLRLVLIRVDALRYHLIYTNHHILMDGWSASQLMGEVLQRYSGETLALNAGRYRDYIQWLQRQDAEASERFWKEQLLALNEPTHLARAIAHTPVAGSQALYGEQRQVVDEPTTQRLRSLAQAHKVTLNTLVQAAWLLLLKRYTGQSSVAFGATVSGRPADLKGVEQQIGLFINTLPVIASPQPEQSLESWLHSVQQLNLRLREYEYTPLFDIQRWAAQDGGDLFDSLLVFENYPVSEVLQQEAPKELVFKNVSYFERTNYPLTVMIGVGQTLAFNFSYQCAHFAASTIVQVSEQLLAVLEQMLEVAADSPLGELKLFETSQQQMLHDWNRTAATYPAGQCIQQLIEEQATRTPDAVALVFAEQQLSYAELNTRANQWAHRLLELGVGPDVLVGVAVERSLEMVVGLLAVLKAGGAYVPLDPEYPQDRLGYMIEDSGLKLLLSQAHLALPIPAHVQALDLGQALSGYSSANPQVTLDPENLAYAIYTSGSTGKPKGVMVRHGALTNFIVSMAAAPGIGAQDRLLSLTTFSFDIFGLELYTPLMVGGRVVLASQDTQRDPELILQQVQAQGITLLQATPSTWRMLLESPNAGALAGRRLLCGGEALADELAVRMTALGAQTWNLYGPTETTIWSALQPLSSEHSHPYLGKAINNTSLYILGEDLSANPVGVAGELLIGGDGLARGYFERPALTAERFLPNPYGEPGGRFYRTGDLARYRADGVIDYISRIDHQVKIRGFRIELGEIEARLLEQVSVVEAVVVAIPGPTGPRLVGYVVPQDRLLPAAEQQRQADFVSQLSEQLSIHLADYMVPSSLVLLERMPLTPNGKLDRKALPVPDQALAQQAFVAPGSEVERILADIWQDVLGLRQVGVTDNFFALGGDSISSIQVVSRARQAGLELSPRDIFQHRSIEVLARHIRWAVPAVAADSAFGEQPLHGLSDEQLHGLGLPLARVEHLYPLSPMQQGMLFLGLNAPDAELYINQLSIAVQGLDVERFKRAWGAACERHAILRTGFVWQGLEQPLQFVMDCLELPLVELDLQGAHDLPQRLEQLARDERERGFDLERPPLQRIVLARLGADSYQMVWTYHHLLIDGWSVSQLLGEILQHYSGVALPEPVAYRNYIAWLRQQDPQASQAFWSQQLAGLDEPTYLANAFAAKQRGQGHHALYSRLGEAATERLKGFAQTQHVTLNTLVQAAWLMLLSRYSGQSSVAFGATVAGRPAQLADSERMLGLFINTLPVIQVIDPSRQLGDWLRDIQDYNLQLREREYTPLSDVQRWAGQSGQALFDSIIVFENHPVDQALNAVNDPLLRFGDTGSYGRTNIPMDLMVTLEDGLVIEYMYLQEHFDEASVQSIRRNMEGLLEQLASNAHQPLGNIGLPEALAGEVQPAEREFDGLYVHQRIAQYAARTPQQPAVLFGETVYSYAELDAAANRLAHLLVAEGVGPEVRVGVAMPRGQSLIVALLAVFKAGGAYVPLDTGYPKDRLTYLMEDSGIALLLTDTSLRETLPALAHVRVLELDQLDLADQPVTDPQVRLQAQNLAYVIYTSGSTGLPKGVAVAHGPLAMHCRAIGERYTMSPEDCELLFMSFAFDGAHERWLTTLTHGGRLLIRDDNLWTPEQTFEALHQHGVTVAAFPPVYLQQLAEHAEREGNPPAVRIYCFGGDAVPQASLALAQRALQPQFIINGYGPTETVVTPLIWKAGPDDTCGAAYAPIGSKVGARSTYVLDSDLNPLPKGAAGELYLGGYGMARGYLDRAGLTAERFVLDPFSLDGGRLYRTGDLVRERQDGVFDYLGRIDNQVKIRGFRIELGEIESRLKGCAGVRDAVVVAREGGSGKQLVGYVVAQDSGVDSGWCDRLREQLRGELPDYMVPAHLMVLERMPLTPNGKLDRKGLPDPDVNQQQRGYVAPRTELEKALAQIWQTVLKVEQVGLGDNFFELGGDSILSLQVVAKSRALKVHGFSLKLRDLMQKPTIGELTGSGEAPALAAKPVSILTMNQAETEPAPLFCVHAGFGTVFDYEPVARLLAGRRSVQAIQCRMLLDANWQDSSLERMAVDYVDDLRARQPHGPYHLLGWSLGGTLAILMTAELERQGQQVEFLGLMDSFVPGTEPAGEMDDGLEDLHSFIQVMMPGVQAILPVTLDETPAGLRQLFAGLLAQQTVAVGSLSQVLGADELGHIFSVARRLKRLSLALARCPQIQAAPHCWWAAGHEAAAQALGLQIGQDAAGPSLSCGHFEVPRNSRFLESLDQALTRLLTPISA